MTTVDLSWKFRAQKAEGALKRTVEALEAIVKEFEDHDLGGACWVRAKAEITHARMVLQRPESYFTRAEHAGAYQKAVNAGCEPLWYHGLYGPAWHCRCEPPGHRLDQQCSMLEFYEEKEK